MLIDFVNTEKLFLLFKYPWGLRPPRAMTEAIFVLPQVPGTLTPQGNDGSYFCSSPSTPRDSLTAPPSQD
jgi:hypothetical protein